MLTADWQELTGNSLQTHCFVIYPRQVLIEEACYVAAGEGDVIEGEIREGETREEKVREKETRIW